MKIIISLLFILFINSSYSSTLNLKDGSNCVYSDSVGNKFDLSSIGYLTIEVSSINRGYGLNLCNRLSGESQLCGTNEDGNQPAICVTDNYKNKEEWQPFVLGYLPPTQIVNNSNHNLDLLYKGQTCTIGLNRFIVESTVNIKCASENKIFSVLSSSTAVCAKTFTFEIGSPIFCSGGGLSGGDVFLIIFFVGLGVYFIVGCLIQFYRKRKGQPIDSIIPNISFWIGFGGLIKDGALYIKGKITGSSSGSSYTPI